MLHYIKKGNLNDLKYTKENCIGYMQIQHFYIRDLKHLPKFGFCWGSLEQISHRYQGMTVKDRLGGRGTDMEKLTDLCRAPDTWAICALNYNEVGDLYKWYCDLDKSQILKTEACVNYMVATL